MIYYYAKFAQIENTVPFETMRMLLGEAASIDLKLLPDSLNLIPEHITEFLPFALPISEHKQTRAVNPTSRPKTTTEPILALPTGPDALSPDFSDMVGILREKYKFRRLPNDYILARPFTPNDPTKIKTDLIYTYPITDKQLAITFLTEVKCRYKFRLLLLRSIMMLNLTDKLELSIKVEDIHDFSIAIPITSLKQLVDTARMLREVYYFDRLLEQWIDMIPITVDLDTTTKLDLLLKLEKLTSYVKDNIPDIAAQVSITGYDTAFQTIRAIQDHFNFTLIPNYLINLPDLPTPEWGIFNDEPNHV
ncbi:12840_t:CDS:2 [Gigaspora margarita]|uniref:12840_t:CDS:1 n=1 Tax=Gigaspora margarita TaxID=4874 RepID=A0ABN7UM31_GIGMA|nr:12840_t:CDS:2 [Gigaspora margarita]